jgi:hypothetical protein
MKRKLELNRETIRTLTSREMMDVAGGKPRGTSIPPINRPSKSCIYCTFNCKPNTRTIA